MSSYPKPWSDARGWSEEHGSGRNEPDSQLFHLLECRYLDRFVASVEKSIEPLQKAEMPEEVRRQIGERVLGRLLHQATAEN